MSLCVTSYTQASVFSGQTPGGEIYWVRGHGLVHFDRYCHITLQAGPTNLQASQLWPKCPSAGVDITHLCHRPPRVWTLESDSFVGSDVFGDCWLCLGSVVAAAKLLKGHITWGHLLTKAVAQVLSLSQSVD